MYLDHTASPLVQGRISLLPVHSVRAYHIVFLKKIQGFQEQYFPICPP